jgi:hypothetical protein
MEKNSVPLKEVLTRMARDVLRAVDADDATRAQREANDMRETPTPRCQHQRSADF